MYVLDDVVYAGEPTNNIKIVQALPLPNFILLLTFSTGEQRLFDVTTLKGSAFEPLKNEKIFKDITVNYGYVSWDNGEIDCSPEYMYKHSYKYTSTKVSGDIYE